MNKNRIRCYDNGGKTIDRYTVIFLDEPENPPGSFAAYAMSAEPFYPQGFGQYCSAVPGRHLGLRIRFEDLPKDCQKLINQFLKEAS